MQRILPTGEIITTIDGQDYLVQGNTLTPFEVAQSPQLTQAQETLSAGAPASAPPAVIAPTIATIPSAVVPAPSATMPIVQSAPSSDITMTTEHGLPIDPGNERLRASGASRQLGAAETIATEVQPELGKFESELARETAKIEAETKNQLDAARSALRLEEIENSMKSTIDAMRSTTIDINRVFGEPGTWSRALAGLAVTLGAGAQAYGATENPGLRIINDAINRDIDAQKFRYQTLKDSAAQQLSLFGMNSDRFKNESAAIAMTKAQALTAVQSKISALMAETSNKEKLARLEDIRGKLELSIAESYDKARQIMSDKIRTEERLRGSGVDLSTRLDAHKSLTGIIEKDKQLNNYIESSRDLRTLERALLGDLQGVSDALIVAKQLELGSYGPELAKSIKKMGLVPTMENILRSKTGRPQDSPFWKNAMNMLKTVQQEEYLRLKPKIDNLRETAEAAGIPADAILNLPAPISAIPGVREAK